MNNDPSCAPQSSAVRRALVLAGSTVLFATSCGTTSNYGPDGNVFAPPRYGYGSPQTGNAGRPASPADRSGSKPSDGRKTPDIKRDPSDTTVDITPPDTKPEPKTTTDGVEPATSPDPSAAPDSTTGANKPVDSGSPVESKPAVTREDLPFGQPVVGKKGYVYSPYAPDKGQVDVDGIPAGTKVKCPYTGKVFRVP